MKWVNQRLQDRDDSAFVLILLALMLTTLIGIAGFSIDIGNWYLHIQRAQRAADAGALAGAVSLPDNVTTADSDATTVLLNNGFQTTDVAYAGPYAVNSYFMQVTLKVSVKSIFLQFFGYDSFSFERTGVARYRAPIEMGSDTNVLGVEPSEFPQWSTGVAQHFVLTGNAAAVDKKYADRWGTQGCIGGTPSTPPDNCAGGLNLEYRPGGQVYAINVAPGATGTLAIEAYDPEFADAGTSCGNPSYIGLAGVWGGPLPINYAPYATDPEVCNGDTHLGARGDDNANFSLWTPVGSPGGSTEINDGVQCQERSYTPLSSAPGNWTAPYWASQLKAPVANIYATNPANTFHKWTRVCDLNIDGAVHGSGEYLLHVQLEGIDPTAAVGNMFALRAGFIDSSGALLPAKSKDVNVYGKQRLVTVVESSSSAVVINMAKFSSAWAGTTASIQTYDLGDNAVDNIAFQWGDGTPVSACTMSFKDGQVPSQTSTGGCLLNFPGTSSSVLNSRVATFDIDIPGSFTCDPTNQSCWLKLLVNYKSGVGVFDGSSWYVADPATPVALFIPPPAAP